MQMNKRHMLTLALGSTLLAALPAVPAAAQEKFPDRPITFVVPFSPGGPTDTMARLLAVELTQELGQSVVVDNRAGAGGNIGAEAVARAKPDGYTILFGTSGPLAINHSLYKDIRYDPRTSFEPVIYVGYLPNVLVVRPNLGAASVQQLIARDKAEPGKLNYASSGNGSLQHVTGAMLEQQGAIKMVHVPYKGTGPALQDLLGGQVDLTFGTAPPFMPHIASGKLRVLAVTGKERLPSLPDVPTTAEVGYPKVDATSWFAVFVPAAVPGPVVDKLTADIRTVVQNPAFKQKALEQGATADYQTPAQLGEKVKADLANWAQVVKSSKIEAE